MFKWLLTFTTFPVPLDELSVLPLELFPDDISCKYSADTYPVIPLWLIWYQLPLFPKIFTVAPFDKEPTIEYPVPAPALMFKWLLTFTTFPVPLDELSKVLLEIFSVELLSADTYPVIPLWLIWYQLPLFSKIFTVSPFDKELTIEYPVPAPDLIFKWLLTFTTFPVPLDVAWEAIEVCTLPFWIYSLET